MSARDGLSKEPAPQARRAIRARARRLVASLVPQARAAHCISVLGADGAAAAGTGESPALLAAHWGAIFAEPERPDEGTVRRLLGHARLLGSDVELAPLTFHEFVAMAGCARHSAPGARRCALRRVAVVWWARDVCSLQLLPCCTRGGGGARVAERLAARLHSQVSAWSIWGVSRCIAGEVEADLPLQYSPEPRL